MSVAGRRATGATLPPWPWFFVLGYLVGVPATASRLAELFGELWGGSQPTQVLALTELVPQLLLAVAMMAVLVPSIRGRVIVHRRTVQLTRPDYPSVAPFLHEIEAEVAAHRPDVTIVYDLDHTVERFFTFPLGWRRPALAIVGGSIPLWVSQKAAAQAVLHHELAHVDAGDHLVVGRTSLLSALARYWLPIYGGAMLLAVALSAGGARGPVSGLRPEIVRLSGQLLLVGLLPAAANWTAELQADRVMPVGDPEVSRGAFSHRKLSLVRYLLQGFSHPPVRLRRAAVGSERLAPWFLTALGFPLALLIGWLAALVLGWLAALVAGVELGAATNLVVLAASTDSRRIGFQVLAAAVLVLMWPVVRPAWLYLFGLPVASRPKLVIRHAVGGALLASVALVVLAV